MSDAAAVDPEEAFVASLAACHMLWFLSIAAGAGYVVDQYRDAADRRDDQERTGASVDVDGHAAPRGALCRPTRAGPDEFKQLHHRAHDACFIANSVKSEVRCEPVQRPR